MFKALKLKGAQENQSVSNIVNEDITLIDAEDAKELANRILSKLYLLMGFNLIVVR